jgi:hypothetical protein
VGIIKAIVEKFKLIELVAILLVASLIITVLPEKKITQLGLEGVKQYQMYISLCLIICISYYVFFLISYVIRFGRKILYGKRVGINYMKKYMSTDEMELLIETFYDRANNSFNASGYIEYHDGRKAALEGKRIIYSAANLSYEITMFAYNLQPYAREFLNRNLKNGNITIEPNRFTYRLR